jgi:trk system potassium uptake protein
MHYSALSKIVGVFLLLLSFGMLPPVLVNFIYHQSEFFVFYVCFAICFVSGLILWLPFCTTNIEIRVKDGFLIVVLFWLVLGLFGTLPFLLTNAIDLSFTNALFESMSGLTTTGATILVHIDDLPKSILFYRQELQFIGGMGIIVLAVAILPMLGVGGMQLFRAEMPGPVKDAKLTPRIQETAKTLWYIYVGLDVLCTLGYWLSGMPMFDAICQAFSTVATGGFSVHSSSFGFYDSPAINIVGVVFMILSSINFALHYTILRKRSFSLYFRDIECRTFLFILLLVGAIAFSILAFNRYYDSQFDVLVDSIFDVVSIVTTTGFTSSSFAYWPGFLPILLITVAIIGGCSSSTAGGIKIVRFILLLKQGARELKKLIHPNAVFPIKFGKHVLASHVIEGIWGYLAIFILIFVAMILILTANGLDLTTAYGAVVASLGNVGASIAGVSDNFNGLNNFSKWTLVFGMILGRLEIFTILVLFTPHFWRK